MEYTVLRKYNFGSDVSWSNLSAVDQEWIKLHATIKHLAKKEILFEQDSTPIAVYFVRRGKVKAIRSNTDGSNQVLFFYVEGDFFGYRPLLAEELQPVSIVAIEPTDLFQISKSRFRELLSASTSLSEQLLVSLSREFGILVNRIINFTQRDTRHRLALALLLLHEKFVSVAHTEAETPIVLTRSDLADYVGTSLETLVRLLGELKEQNVLKIEGKKIFILQMRKLLELADLH